MSESVHLLSGAYAAGALDPAERAEFEEHLAGCPDCAAEVRGLLDTTARLASAEAVTPPARLKAAVLAQIATTPQLPRQATAHPSGPDGASPAADSVVVPMRRPGWSPAQRFLAVAAAALAVAAVGLSALLVQAEHARSQLDATQAAVTRVLTASDARSLTGALSAGGKATIVVSSSEGTSVFLGTGLRPAPPGHTYELWYMGGAGGSPVPAGTFAPDPTGHVATVLAGTIGTASAIGVTVEPAGGSPAPTTRPVLAVRLTG